MRASARHELTGPATCASLVLALFGACAAIVASAPVAFAGTQIQVGPLVKIEAEPLPAKVEVAGVTIETPALPGVEVPSLPPVSSPVPVETPTTPTTPPTGTPVPIPPGATGSPSGSGSGSSGAGASGAGAQPTGTAASTGGGAQTSSGTHTTAAASPSGRSPRRTSATQRLGSARSRAKRVAGAVPASLLAASSPASGSTAAPARSTRPAATHAKSSSGNPLEAIGRQIPFPVPVPDWSKPIILALLLIAIWFAVRSRLATLRARRLEGQRETMLSDLGDMQAALVPAIPPQVGPLSVSVAYHPADGPAAGGDFYDIFALEESKVAIVIGDVVGHGRPALTQAALTRYTLRAYLQAGLEPRAALALAGSVLASPGEKRFATVVIAVHDGATGRLTYACAGHPAPIAIGFDAPDPIAVCCSAPICCDLPTGRRQTTISLPAGARMCFFSDGLPEARIGEDLLGRERLSEIVRELGPSAGAPELLERVGAAADATPDDMVACLISPVAADAAPVSAAAQVEELEVDAHALDGPRVASFLDACGISGTHAASLLAQAADVVAREGSALLRIERPRAGEPTATVSAGSPVPGAAPAAVAEGTSRSAPALALAAGR